MGMHPAQRALDAKCPARPNAFQRLRLGKSPSRLAWMYALLGVCASVNQNYEVFPFFSWFLFPLTPHYVERYELSPKPSLTALGALHLTDLDQLVQRLGKAVDAGDQKQTLEVRSLLEQNFLMTPCGYRVVKLRYDPLARWGDASAVSQSNLEFGCQQAR